MTNQDILNICTESVREFLVQQSLVDRFVKNVIEQGIAGEELGISSAFRWNETPEGSAFWIKTKREYTSNEWNKLLES